jgi:hypothetical protein
MIEDVRPTVDDRTDFVEFVSTGEPGSGAYRCAECRYGICLRGELPPCPMCGGTVWEATGTAPAFGDRIQAI